jgi:ATP-binding cassette subfamily C (CFTR/MRP) protein 1
MITQKLWFQKRTIRENVCFGQPYDSKKLRKVYEQCGLEEHLLVLPKGDETPITHHSAWSSNRKLRIAIARALYSQPDIVFFDEPFASVDP